jgi:hypothetical protein
MIFGSLLEDDEEKLKPNYLIGRLSLSLSLSLSRSKNGFSDVTNEDNNNQQLLVVVVGLVALSE